MRSIRMAAVTVATAAMLLAGCTGEAGPADPGATTSVPTTPALAYQEVLDRISVAGTADRPLYWELVDPDDPEAVAAMEVVRHYEALINELFAQDPPVSERVDLLPYLATDEHVDMLRGIIARPDPNDDSFIGPRWIQMLDADVGARTATVTTCFDSGYWARASHGGGSPPARPVGERSSLNVYSLTRDQDDPSEQWRVAQVASNPTDAVDRFGEQCERWATHELDDTSGEGEDG